MDAWITARRLRERALNVPDLSRDERMDVAREVEVLRRTHDEIKGRCARGLNNAGGPMRVTGPTAVVAHRQAWFVDKLANLLAGHGVTVVACTDNGAVAVGAVVAEQPDIVLVGDCLAMLAGRAVLAEARLYAPRTLLAIQVPDPKQAHALQALAEAIFLRHEPPAAIAQALTANVQPQVQFGAG